jgi:hypothetical protein
MKIIKKTSLPKIDYIEQKTVDIWLSLGTIKVTDYGHENTYYVDQFGNQFYCKNYPVNSYKVLAMRGLEA